MPESVTTILLWILMGAGILALIALFVVLIKLVKILTKMSISVELVNNIIADTEYKSKLLNAPFEYVDKTFRIYTNGVLRAKKLFFRKKDKKNK